MTRPAFALSLLLAALGCGTGNPFARGEPSDGGPDGGGLVDDDSGTVDVSFFSDVDPVLYARCSACHGGGAGGLTLKGDPAADYDAVLAFVVPGAPDESRLLSAATGQAHGGGAVLDREEDDFKIIEAWIIAGAPEN